MKKNLFKLGVGIASLFCFAAPALALNLCPTNLTVPGCNGGATITPDSAVSTILNLLLFVAFVAALVFLIIGGIKWIISAGDKEGASKAKETVTSALIGLAVVLGAWVLMNIVTTFFGISGTSGLAFPTLGGCPTGQTWSTLYSKCM